MKGPGLKGNLIPRRSPNSPLSKQNLEPRESSINEVEMDSYVQATKPTSEDTESPQAFLSFSNIAPPTATTMEGSVFFGINLSLPKT